MSISVIGAGNAVTADPVDPGESEHSKKDWQRASEKFLKACTPSVLTITPLATQALALLLFYEGIWGYFQTRAEPGSPLFALLLLVVCCYIGGIIASLGRLPPLIGMLLVGFLYRNLPFLNFYKDIPEKWSAALRNMALVVILLKAGLGLNPAVLKKLSFICLRLAFFPCLMEAISTATASFFLLDFSWAWGFILGFVLSAVSPAVVIPSMLLLEEKGFGQNKGITTLVIAAASIDDVFAIAGFGVSIGIAFSKGNLVWTLIKGPLEVIVGLAYGGVVGVLFWYLPHTSDERKVFYRVLLLTFGGLGASFISIALEFSGAGALACLSLAFVAALRWREDDDRNVFVCDAIDGLWLLLQTFLFGLIGAEVSIADLEKDIGYGLAVLFIGLTVRILAAYLSLFKSDFNFKEKIFVAFAWLPKATVQAAIGSVALDLAVSLLLKEEIINRGRQILTVAVLSIIFTAPVGALAIALLAPILLHQSKSTETSEAKKDSEAKEASETKGDQEIIEAKSSPKRLSLVSKNSKDSELELAEAIV